MCAEFCGLDHHKMRFSVRIVTPDEFEQWLQEQRRARREAGTMTALDRDRPADRPDLTSSIDDVLVAADAATATDAACRAR